MFDSLYEPRPTSNSTTTENEVACNRLEAIMDDFSFYDCPFRD